MNLELKSTSLSNQENLTSEENNKVNALKNELEIAFDQFVKELELQKSNEEKLLFAIDFMKRSLSQHGQPDFKGFWDVRKLTLDIFKENVNPIVRAKLWDEFVSLSQEARKLKDILDEEAVFAKEQLEIAINALQTDISDFENQKKLIADIEIPESCFLYKTKYDQYNLIQKELNLLNAFAGRINSLRKEIIKIGIRLRYKSKFLKTLSSCGDQVFPKRKELIKEISSIFVKDVDDFIEKNFSESQSFIPFYVLKKEIKDLQSIAKILTLNTKAFTETRLNLSKCWDKIKDVENEKKQQQLERKDELKANFEKIQKLILEFKEKCLTDLSLNEAEKLAEEIKKEMKDVELISFDVKILKKELKEAFAPILVKQEEMQNKIKREKEELLIKKKEDFENIISEIEKLTVDAENISLDDLVSKKDQMMKDIKNLSLNKIEKQRIDRIFKPLKDVIIDKKEKELLNLSSDQLQALDQMKSVLKQRMDRKNEIKSQIEKYRKEIGSSGLDFEKAMIYRESMNLEKERLEKIIEAIEEIEMKISEIEGN